MTELQWNQIADTMKQYERANSTTLDPNKPIVIRLDMRAGGSFVRGLEKPWDDAFTQAMSTTAQKLAEQVQGAQLAYVGSDEITLLLFNNSEKEHFTPFFNGKLQKIVSITAAMATAEFNKKWLGLIETEENLERKELLQSKLFSARFDSRAFNIDGDVRDALLSVWWRVTDVARNSVQMLARHHFSQKQLNGIGTKEMLIKLESIGHHWDDEVTSENKYGNIFIREAYVGEGERINNMDIGSGTGYPSAALSNFSPHSFVIDGVECASMEGFLQSLKFQDPEMQKHVCTLVGKTAKFKGKKKKWWKTQTLYWKGEEIPRSSERYQELLDDAFTALSKNDGFRRALLATQNATLTHNIGKKKESETVLTRTEFTSRLTKIRNELQKGN